MKNFLKLMVAALALFAMSFSSFAQSWKLTSAPTGNWTSLAVSADGVNLWAARSAGVYRSTDSGATWTASTNISGINWLSVASSADGSKLAAVSGNNNQFYISTNSGAAWTLAAVNCFAIAVSADGSKMVAANSSGNYTTGSIYISADSGATWSQATNAPNLGWFAVSCSANGSVIAAIANGNGIYISTDSGNSWTMRRTVGTAFAGVSGAISMSDDGSKIIASAAYKEYVSTNTGVSWFTNNVPQGSSIAVRISADGTKGLLAISGYPVFTSTNSGVNWFSNSIPKQTWAGACSSADGSKLAAAAYGGGIYTWQYAPMLNLASADTNLIVSWLDSSYTNFFALQQNADLTTANWADVGLPVSDDGTNKSITLPVPASNLFFRLSHP